MIDIKHKEDCCGCSACVQACPKSCISFNEDEEGFCYLKVNLVDCINCGLCEKVCPVINQDSPREPLHIYASKNLDEDIRLKSSSGGVFTLLAEKVIEEGGVVFGAQFNKQWEVIHSYRETKEGLVAFRGSKYAQSRIGSSYTDAAAFLKAGRKVLFSGTPCHIAGLKRFLRKNYDNLLTVDIVCHSVPSPKIWSLYLDAFISIKLRTKIKDSNLSIEKISFREKKPSWKNYSFSISGEFNGEKFKLRELQGRNLYMRGFLSDLYTRPSCYSCPTKESKSRSDITLSDFWGIENILPAFDDEAGVSLVIINSEVGATAYHALNAKSVQLDKNAIQHSYYHIAKAHVKRKFFFATFNSPDASLLPLIRLLTSASLKSRIKHLIILIAKEIGLCNRKKLKTR